MTREDGGIAEWVSPPRLRRTSRHPAVSHMGHGFTSAPAENIETGGELWATIRFHLRACGEHTTPPPLLVCSTVSPPRLRRTLQRRLQRRRVYSFTSAPAENIDRQRVDRTGVGFTSAPAENIRTAAGSRAFPRFHLRARGEQPPISIVLFSQRSTSSPVGNSKARAFNAPTEWLHLRACGEHIDSKRFSPAVLVSPPRQRRTFKRIAARWQFWGFTSAPAENSSTTRSAPKSSSFHLRYSGEQIVLTDGADFPIDSPPRLRRTPHIRRQEPSEGGFTSALAENITWPPGHQATFRFHLRACGEHPSVPNLETFPAVSPPRQRRTSPCGLRRRAGRSFTSAPAENILASYFAASLARFHLRACGEHDGGNGGRSDRLVSPPRQRRTPQFLVVHDVHLGFTSAPAENRWC